MHETITQRTRHGSYDQTCQEHGLRTVARFGSTHAPRLEDPSGSVRRQPPCPARMTRDLHWATFCHSCASVPAMHGRPFGALPFRHLSPTSMRKGRTFGPHTPDLHDCRVSWTETVRWNLTCSAPHHRPGECIRTADRDTTLSASGHREALQEGRWPVQRSPCYCDHLTRQCSLFTRAVAQLSKSRCQPCSRTS